MAWECRWNRERLADARIRVCLGSDGDGSSSSVLGDDVRLAMQQSKNSVKALQADSRWRLRSKQTSSCCPGRAKTRSRPSSQDSASSFRRAGCWRLEDGRSESPTGRKHPRTRWRCRRRTEAAVARERRREVRKKTWGPSVHPSHEIDTESLTSAPNISSSIRLTNNDGDGCLRQREVGENADPPSQASRAGGQQGSSHNTKMGIEEAENDLVRRCAEK